MILKMHRNALGVLRMLRSGAQATIDVTLNGEHHSMQVERDVHSNLLFSEPTARRGEDAEMAVYPEVPDDDDTVAPDPTNPDPMKRIIHTEQPRPLPRQPTPTTTPVNTSGTPQDAGDLHGNHGHAAHHGRDIGHGGGRGDLTTSDLAEGGRGVRDAQDVQDARGGAQDGRDEKAEGATPKNLRTNDKEPPARPEGEATPKNVKTGVSQPPPAHGQHNKRESERPRK